MTSLDIAPLLTITAGRVLIGFALREILRRREVGMMCLLRGVCRAVGACGVIVGAIFFAPNVTRADDAPAAQAPVDAATKKLMAANGLFTRGLFKLAAEQYTEFLSENASHPQATAARYALAVCRYRLHEFPDAVEKLRLVLADSKFDQRDEALAVLGHCELAQQHYEPALAALDELLAKYPQSKHAERAALTRGQVLYLSKKYAEAAKACEGFVAQFPQSAGKGDALYFLALSQRELNQNADAVKTLTRLSSEVPNFSKQVDADLLMGQALEADGKTAEAVEAYRKMLAAAPSPRKPDALYSLGIALYRIAKYDESATQLKSLITDFPDSSYVKLAKLQLGLAELAQNEIKEARNTLDAVAREDPPHAADARYGLAQCDMTDKRYEPARQMLDSLLQAQPAPANASQIALDHAVCTMELGQFQPASDELGKLRSQYPQSAQIPEATYRLAFCLHRLGKFDASHELCGQVAKLKAPELIAPNSELDAENLFLLARYSEAEKQFADLSASTKDDAKRLRFSYRQGQCEYFASNYAKAAELLKPIASDASADKNPDLQGASLLLGNALRQMGKDSDSIEPLKHYLQISQAERQQALYTLGMAQLATKDEPAARGSFQQATQGPGDSPWVQRAWFELGQLDLKAKEYTSAATAFRRVVLSGAAPEVAGPAQYQLGWAEFESKQSAKAAATWKEMAEKYPKDKLAPEAAYQQGVALHEAKQLPQASAALLAYATTYPGGKHVIAAKQLAAACMKESGNNGQAEKMLADLANSAKGPEAAGVLFDLAMSQQEAKSSAAAQASYRKLLVGYPDDALAPAARTNLAILLYDDSKYDQAATYLEKVTGASNVDPKILAVAQYRLGLCYEKLNKPDKAAAMFAAYKEKGTAAGDDVSASALVHAGLAYANDGHFDKAEQSLTEMLKQYPTHKDALIALLKLGEVQAELQNYAGSVDTFGQFLQKYPKSEFVYRAEFGVGWADENLKRYDDARAAYKKVIAASNTETAARAQFQIGESLLEEGKFEPGIAALLAVDDVYKYPAWSARALFEAGRAFEQIKQPEQARKQYSDVVAKYKDSPQAAMAQDRLKNIAGS
jgi:TolA-binding protein